MPSIDPFRSEAYRTRLALFCCLSMRHYALSAVLASGTIANGGSFSLSNSWKAGDAAGPAKILITGAQGTVECGWGGYNNGNEIVTTIKGQAATVESVDGPFPNTRTTMYYQLTVRKILGGFVGYFLLWQTSMILPRQARDRRTET